MGLFAATVAYAQQLDDERGGGSEYYDACLYVLNHAGCDLTDDDDSTVHDAFSLDSLCPECDEPMLEEEE